VSHAGIPARLTGPRRSAGVPTEQTVRLIARGKEIAAAVVDHEPRAVRNPHQVVGHDRLLNVTSVRRLVWTESDGVTTVRDGSRGTC